MTDLNTINEALAQFDPFETENEKKVLARVVSELIKDKEDRTFVEVVVKLNEARREADQIEAKRKAEEEEKRIAQLDAEAKKKFEADIKAKIAEMPALAFCQFKSSVISVWQNGTHAVQYDSPLFHDNKISYGIFRQLDPGFGCREFGIEYEDEFEEFVAIFEIPCIRIDRNRYDVVAVGPNGSFLARDRIGETSSEWRVVSDFDKALEVGLETYWEDEANHTQDIDEALTKIANAD